MKIAITKNEYDLLRIIPFNETEKNDKCEFKISMLDNNYTLRLKQIDTPYFLNLEANINDYEITYHRKQNKQPTKIHFKNIREKEDYRTFPLFNLEDPLLSEDFPFPLLLLGVSINDVFKKINKNKQYSILNLQNDNVLELFIANEKFDMEFFFKDWNIFSLLIMTLPLEYYATGKIDRNLEKMDLFLNPNKNFNLLQSTIKVSDRLNIIGNSYYDKNINGEKQKSYIQLYDNSLFLKYLSCIPMQYKFDNGKKTPIRRAYELQMESIKGKIPNAKFKHYENMFKKWHEEIERDKIKLDGIIIPF